MEKINWLEIDWRLEAAGTWPKPIKIATCLLLFVITTGLGYYFAVQPLIEEKEEARRKEEQLKQSLRRKWEKAANLTLYQKQLEEIEKLYQRLVYQLPTQEEMPGFLKDVSDTATSSQLTLLLFKPKEERRREFYAEIPITLKAQGNFDAIGTFLSSLAALPRIITVHDIEIRHPGRGSAEKYPYLEFQALLKTYRYLSEEERELRRKKRRRRRRR